MQSKSVRASGGMGSRSRLPGACAIVRSLGAAERRLGFLRVSVVAGDLVVRGVDIRVARAHGGIDFDAPAQAEFKPRSRASVDSGATPMESTTRPLSRTRPSARVVEIVHGLCASGASPACLVRHTPYGSAWPESVVSSPKAPSCGAGIMARFKRIKGACQ